MSRSKISQELIFLAKELKKHQLCGDVRPIDEALGELNSYSNSPNNWGYNLQKLTFNNIETPRGTMPNNLSSIKVILNVEIHEKKIEETAIINPVVVESGRGIKKSYNFSIEISGYSGKKRVLANWHLDFDNHDQHDYIHPNFHLTFGGNAMKSIDDDENDVFGKVLIPPTPRIPHPPMDAILGIDFILRHFVKKNIARNITETREYKKMIIESQFRLWRPYMLACAHHWCKFNCSGLTTENGLCKKYQPSLMD